MLKALEKSTFKSVFDYDAEGASGHGRDTTLPIDMQIKNFYFREKIMH